MTRPAPTTKEEWFRDVERRLQAVENPQALRAGQFVFTHRDGALVLSDGTGNQVTIARQDGTTGELVLPTPAEIGAVSTADIKLSVDPPPEGGGPLSFITDLLSGKWLGIGTAQTTGDGAQSSANTANVGLAILNGRVNEIVAGGVSLYDTFDRDGADLGPDYTDFDESGSGTMGTTVANNGTTICTPAGFSDRILRKRHNTPLATNKQRLSMVLDDFTFGFAGNQSHAYLIACANAAMTEYVIAKYGGDGKCEIGVQLTTGYTRLGPQVDCVTSGGDLWDIEVGYGGDPRRFRLVQNNNVKVDQDDLGHLAILDSDHLYPAFGEDFAIGAGPFGTTYQQAPPNIQVFAAGDF